MLQQRTVLGPAVVVLSQAARERVVQAYEMMQTCQTTISVKNEIGIMGKRLYVREEGKISWAGDVC